MIYAQLNELDGSEEIEEAIVLAAPTGRAAKRMNELTGYPASIRFIACSELRLIVWMIVLEDKEIDEVNLNPVSMNVNG